MAINVDPADAAKNYEPDVVVEGDAALAADLAAQVDAARASPGSTSSACARTALSGPAARRSRPSCASSTRVPPDDAIVVRGHVHPRLLARPASAACRRRGRLAYPMGWGTLGFAFPAGARRRARRGDGPVVSVSGDGGFLFACGELATVAQERIPLTVVIVDDGGYGMLRYDQDAARSRTLRRRPAHARLRRAGRRRSASRAETVDGLGDAFEAALRAHLDDPGPSVLVARAALEPPPTTSPRWYRKQRA